MIVLVCGGRDYQNYSRVSEVLNAIHYKTPISLIVHGAAQGADSLAEMWADEHVVPNTKDKHQAQWRLYGRMAGPIRNHEMLATHKISLVVAFPGGSGTADMLKKARAAHIPIEVIS